MKKYFLTNDNLVGLYKIDLMKYLLIIVFVLIGYITNGQTFENKIYVSEQKSVLALQALKAMKLTKLEILINQRSEDEIRDYRALVFKNNNLYIMNIYGVFTFSALKKMIVHECVHIEQMEKGDLIINGNAYTYKGVEYDASKIKYDKRPWEIDAIKRTDEVLKIVQQQY